MLALEVNGEGNVGSQRCLWERVIIRGRTLYGASNNLIQFSYNSLCSETSAICLPAIFSFFLVVFVVMQKTRHSLVIGQLSKRRLT